MLTDERRLINIKRLLQIQMYGKTPPWYTVVGLSTLYQANLGERIIDIYIYIYIYICILSKKKHLNEAGWLAKDSSEVKVILLPGTTFHHVKKKRKQAHRSRVCGQCKFHKEETSLTYFKLFYCCSICNL